MPYVLLLVLGQVSAGEADRTEADRLISLIKGLHSPIEDVSFTFEGALWYVGPKQPEKSKMHARDDGLITRHQGTYSYRNDGATRLDLYRRGFEIDHLMVRSRKTLLNGRYEQLEIAPDMSRSRQPRNPLSWPGNGSSLDTTESPHRILYLWFFHLVPTHDPLQVKVLGTEMVDGHRCTKLFFDLDPDSGPKSFLNMFLWVDLQRGGHVLKFDRYQKSNLAMQLTDVELQEFHSHDKTPIWLPIRGTVNTFRFGEKYYPEPTFRETYDVMPDSVRLNMGLKDHLFSAAYDQDATTSTGIDQEKKEFRERANRPRPGPGTDRESVRKDLDRRLEEADKQAAMIEASSSLRDSGRWSATTVTALVLAFGLCCGVTAVVLRIKRRNAT